MRANTDYRGSEEANLKLSQGRANSVINYLVAHGIKRDRLVAKGMGESSPFVVDKPYGKKIPVSETRRYLDRTIYKIITNRRGTRNL